LENISVNLYSSNFTCRIKEIGDNYVLLESCYVENKKPHFEIKINFDLNDEDEVSFLNLLKRVRDYFLTRKEKAVVGCDLEISTGIEVLLR